MAAARWAVLTLALGASCAKDLCANVDCVRPASSVCVSDTALQKLSRVGSCEPSTGQCIYPDPVTPTPCNAAERCSEGVCRCIPSECDGCCAPGGGCIDRTRLNPASCGSGGAECISCERGLRCEADRGCVSCPPEHIVRNNQCVDDDVWFDVTMAGATRWPPPPFDGGTTLWHVGPAADVIAEVVARSPGANVNGTGRPSATIALSLVWGPQVFDVEVVAPSGRKTRQTISATATRGVSRKGPCHITPRDTVACWAGQWHELEDAGVFVGAADSCGLRADGTVWCVDSTGQWAQRFKDVPDVVDVTMPCARQRSGQAVCDEPDGSQTTHQGPWRSIECRMSACCGISRLGTVSCWGMHYYNLFDSGYVYPDPVYPMPRSVYGFPATYERVTSAHKTFFGMNSLGEWTAASNRMAFPGAIPFVIGEATRTTLKLDSPYYCIFALEADGGVWSREYALNIPPTVVDAGEAIIDLAAQDMGSAAYMLTSSREARLVNCR